MGNQLERASGEGGGLSSMGQPPGGSSPQRRRSTYSLPTPRSLLGAATSAASAIPIPASLASSGSHTTTEAASPGRRTTKAHGQQHHPHRHPHHTHAAGQRRHGSSSSTSPSRAGGRKGDGSSSSPSASQESLSASLPSSREGSVVELEPLSPTSSATTSPSTSFTGSMSPFAALPAPVVARVFATLSADDLLRCSLVSKEWMVLASMDQWWEAFALRDVDTTPLVSIMLHEHMELPHLTHGSWRELYFKYRRKEALARHPRVIALYDYRPRTDRELAVRRGEVLILLARDTDPNSCWWLVERSSTNQTPSGTLSSPSSQIFIVTSQEEQQQQGPEENRTLPEADPEQAAGGQAAVGDGSRRSDGQAAGNDQNTAERDLDTGSFLPFTDIASEQAGDPDASGTLRHELGNAEVTNGATEDKENKKTGWVPSGYLETYHPRKKENVIGRGVSLSGKTVETQERNKKASCMVRASCDYVAANAQELSFKKYDLMAIDLHPKDTYPPTFGVVEENGKASELAIALQRSKKGKWLKASLTRRSAAGGTTTVTGWIPADLVTEDVAHVVSLFDYHPGSEEELPLKKGQRVAVLATDENRKGWIYAQGNGRRGWLPDNYVVDDDEA